MINSREVVNSWAERDGYQTASGSVVFTMRKGDSVELLVIEGDVYEPRNTDRGYTALSGYRVA